MSATKLATKPRRCRVCGVPVDQPPIGRPRTTCSTACRSRAHRRRHASKPAVYHRSGSDEWSTPPDLFAELDRELGPFTLDAAATDANALCPAYFTAADDGLTQEWTGTVWLNPPYSSIAKWVAKAHQSAQEGATVAVLVPARTDTVWWHEHATDAEVRFLRGRLKFGDATSGAPFPSALLIFRPPVVEPRRTRWTQPERTLTR